MKLEKALHTAESAMPARRSFMEFDRPPRLDMKRTASDRTKAPINALIPTKFGPRNAPIPKRMAEVAPRDAPEDMPKM